ncbi:tyrosine phosphatase family-domain-containing protein [Mucor mucedo]|uniref:Tyrosine-protein phosphatase domain-containing protein n=1 Tax=Mucor saturninus TaxID=64648 RepID=A0A8H7VEV0_9FUNG|nr:tyrosine phosphatase family-domain-containing protein [Mucor mucedo]KAG2211914.1 hypothetical protein INT47_004601 [Mucor saturninus]KAI7891632.1 tyrosine phosphatase family-domain-containing protein [Mucor mucedo]
MAARLPNLIPPFRFTIVEENLFRGGYPKPRNIRFLKRLRLKTILSLIPDKIMPEMQHFCDENNIQLLHLNVDKMKEDNIPLTYNKTIMALELMIDPANHPLYIHCLDGADVTGLVIACLRKLQMWSNSSAMSEFARSLNSSVVTSEEFEFIENFKNFDVTIPMTLPSWLWTGQVSFRKHATLRLKFLNPEMMTEEERELKDLKEKKEKEKEDYYKKRKNDLLDNLFDPNTPRHRASPTTANTNNNNTPLPSTPGTDDEFTTNASSTHVTEKHKVDSDAKDPYLVDVDVDVDGVMMDGLDQVEYMNRNAGNSSNSRFYAGDDDDIMEDGDEYEGTRFTTEPISRTLEALALEGLTEF